MATKQIHNLDIKTELQRFERIRAKTEQICAALEIEDYVVQPSFDVSPPKWHLGHTTWFFENFILAEFTEGYKLFNEKFNIVFNSYYKSQGAHWYQGDRGSLSRPSVQEVYTYRKHVSETVVTLINTLLVKNDHDLLLKIMKILAVGMHHEEQHQELLLTDIKNIYSAGPIKPTYQERNYASKEAVPLSFIEISEGLVELGADCKETVSYDDFTFDNEKPKHRVYLEPFSLANRCVTNGEFINFIEDAGYQNYEYWLSDGWNLIQEHGIAAPLYWEKYEGKWFYVTLSGFREVDLAEPITHVNFYEADAFAKWSSARLPREQEWESVARASLLKTNVSLSDYQKYNYLESGNFHPLVSQSHCELGFYDLFGNNWEWTLSGYEPYPGYNCPTGAFGEYNSKFMNNQRVLKGGSCATPAEHNRVTYRNFFYPEKNWQFTGIRLARSL